MSSFLEKVRNQVNNQVNQVNDELEDDVKNCRRGILDSIKARIGEQASLGSQGVVITFDNTIATVPECKPIIKSCSKGNLNSCRQLSMDSAIDDFKKEKFDTGIYCDANKHIYISW